MDLAATLRRIVQAATLRREPFVWMQFEAGATGDALVIVAITSVLLVFASVGSVSLDGLLGVVLSSIVAWLVLAATTWAAGRFIYQASGEYAEVLRVVGFAFPVWLVQIATVRVLDGRVALIVGSIWFLAVITAGVRVVLDLAWDKAAASAGIGFVGWLIIETVFRF